MVPRCRIAAFEDDANLTDAQIAAIFREFDTSGDGFIDLGELQAALSKARKEPVSLDEAMEVLQRVDTNNDGQISLDEFKAVFSLAPNAVPEALRGLFDVRGFFLNVGDVLGIEVRGQWRTTPSGSKYVDDVLGSGQLLTPGDIVLLHYTVTLVDTGAVVETSRTGKPLGFQLGEASGEVQGWNDAVVGMRVGGQRRVYASPRDGSDGPAARYDVEIIGIEAGSDSSAPENIITSVGGRRSAARLLFALSFVPYFLPEEYQPEFFKDDRVEQASQQEAERPVVDKADAYVAQQLNDLFANEVLPSKKQ